MRLARTFVVVSLMMLAPVTGAFAAKGKHRSSIRLGPPRTFQEFLQGQGSQEALIQCDIYCDGTDNPITETTFPGTVSGCLADCEEICGGPCEIAN